MHFSQLSGQEYTVPGMFIANLLDQPSAAMPIAPVAARRRAQCAAAARHNGTAYWIKVSAQTDGSFTVTNARNGFSKTYAALAGGCELRRVSPSNLDRGCGLQPKHEESASPSPVVQRYWLTSGGQPTEVAGLARAAITMAMSSCSVIGLANR